MHRAAATVAIVPLSVFLLGFGAFVAGWEWLRPRIAPAAPPRPRGVAPGGDRSSARPAGADAGGANVVIGDAGGACGGGDSG